MHQLGAVKSCSIHRQSTCARGGSALQAKKTKSASQLPVEYYFTDELFDKYPPPPHMEVDQADFAELRAELLGQKIGGRLPSKQQLKAVECIEQYLLYNSYATYW